MHFQKMQSSNFRFSLATLAGTFLGHSTEMVSFSIHHAWRKQPLLDLGHTHQTEIEGGGEPPSFHQNSESFCCHCEVGKVCLEKVVTNRKSIEKASLNGGIVSDDALSLMR